MSARIITNEGTEEVSDREFFTRAFGHPPRTKDQIEAQWRAKCERYATSIENGFEALVPSPCLRDARKIVEERALTRKVADELQFTIDKQRVA